MEDSVMEVSVLRAGGHDDPSWTELEMRPANSVEMVVPVDHVKWMSLEAAAVGVLPAGGQRAAV